MTSHFIRVLAFSCIFSFLFCYCYAGEDQTTVVAKKEASVVESWIKELTTEYEQKKEKAHESIRESINNAPPIDNQQVAGPINARIELEATETERNIDDTINQQLKGRIEETISELEYTFRKSYVEAPTNYEVEYLAYYEATLHQLVKDGYISIEDVTERESRVSQDWPAARTAYGH